MASIYHPFRQVIRFELLLFVVLYATIELLYIFALSGSHKTTYEKFVLYSRKHLLSIVSGMDG